MEDVKEIDVLFDQLIEEITERDFFCCCETAEEKEDFICFCCQMVEEADEEIRREEDKFLSPDREE